MAVSCEDALNEILSKVRKEQGYENGQTSMTQITSSGVNYTSLLYLTSISEPEKDDLRLFVKLAATKEEMRKTMPYQIFETENYVYTKLFKTYKEIEDKYKIPKEHRFFTPKFYTCNDVYLEEAIVLEDLTVYGYTTFDRFKCIDWEYASKSVENLAKFHALSISWSLEDPDEFEKVPTIQLEKTAGNLENFVKNIIDNAIKVVKEDNKDRLSKFVADMMQHMQDGRYYKPMRRPVIAHGDYRTSNMMHKINEDGTVDIVSLDYQTCQRGNPIIDLMYFIFTGSDKDFREKHFRQTLDHYYSELCAALRRFELDPDDVYSKDDFEYELKKVLPYGLMIALYCLIFVTVDEKETPKVTKNLSITDFVLQPNALYTERINDIVDDYIKMGIL